MLPLDSLSKLLNTPHNRGLMRGKRTWGLADGVCPDHNCPIEDCQERRLHDEDPSDMGFDHSDWKEG